MSTQRSTGVVKWFNNKAGYGFLTVMGDGQTPEDVFVHHSEIQVEKDQYKYLVQGEYVEFVLSTDAGDHKCMATVVRGVNGGRLMCETRSDRAPRVFSSHDNTNTNTNTNTTRDRPSFRGRGGNGSSSNLTRGGQHSSPLRQTEDDQVEWLLVKRTKPHTTTTRGRGGGGRGGGRRPMAELS
uniref:CSD domain-containing protein n=1 Tax=viral metagenome TaxID=1070528 RepID=A0A6C0HGB8_9ZZZZ